MREAKSPASLPPGLSEGEGLLGSVEAGFEIALELDHVDPERIVIVAPAGSGGTCLGLKLAAEYLSLPWRVHGCLIGETLAKVSGRIARLRTAFQRRFGWGGGDDGRLLLTDVAFGLGYNRPQPFELRSMRAALAAHGLLFDPNYMLKAYIGLRRLAASGEIEPRDTAVLFHTGGQIGVFDENAALADWLDREAPDWTKPK